MKKFGTWDVEDIEVEDIESQDYPDFANAYIFSATINGEEATEEQINELNEDPDFLYGCIVDQVF